MENTTIVTSSRSPLSSLPLPPWSSQPDLNELQQDETNEGNDHDDDDDGEDDGELEYPHPLPPYPPLINIQTTNNSNNTHHNITMDESETTPLRPSRRRSMLQLRNARHHHHHHHHQNHRRPSGAERSTGENSMGSGGSSRSTANATAGNNSSTNRKNLNYLSKFLHMFSSSSFSESSSSRISKGDYNTISSSQQPPSSSSSLHQQQQQQQTSKNSFSLPNNSNSAVRPLNSTINHTTPNSNTEQLNHNSHGNSSITTNTTTTTTTTKKKKKIRKKRRFLRKKEPSLTTARRKTSSVLTLGTIELSLLDDEEIYEDEDFYNGEYNEYASYHPVSTTGDFGGSDSRAATAAGYTLSLSKEEMDDHASFASRDDLGDMYSSHYIYFSSAKTTTTDSAAANINMDGIKLENDKHRVQVGGERQEDSLSSLDSASLTIPDIHSKKSGISDNDHTTSGATMGGIDEEGEEEAEEEEEEASVHKKKMEEEGGDNEAADHDVTSNLTIVPCHEVACNSKDTPTSKITATNKSTSTSKDNPTTPLTEVTTEETESIQVTTKSDESLHQKENVQNTKPARTNLTINTSSTSLADNKPASTSKPIAVHHIQDQIMSLHKAGSMFYSRGYHEDAWNVQNQAYELICYLSSLDQTQGVYNNHTNLTMNQAKLKYDIARSRLALLKRKSRTADAAAVTTPTNSSMDDSSHLDTNTSSEETETQQGSLQDLDSISIFTTQEESPSCQRAYQDMINARHTYWIKSIVYYEQELSNCFRDNRNNDLESFLESQHEVIVGSASRGGEEGGDSNDDDDGTKSLASEHLLSLPIQPSKPTDQTCHILYILHTLGRLYDENLSQYREALKYYKCALKVESDALSYLQELNQRRQQQQEDQLLQSPSQGSVLQRRNKEIRQWKLRVRNTKQKIGSIYYLNGRFDLALTSSFGL